LEAPGLQAHSGFYENALYKFTFTYLLTYLLTRGPGRLNFGLQLQSSDCNLN